MSAKEQLMKITVKNPDIDLLPDETCYYQTNAKLGIPHTEYVTTTKTKPGLGVGVRLTKHLGVGIGRQKVTTKTESQTVWDKTSCKLFMLDTRFVIRLNGRDEAIPYDYVTGLKVNRDALTISSKYNDYYLFMANSDVKRFMEVYNMVLEAAKEEMGSDNLLSGDKKEISAPKNKKRVSGDFAKTVFLWGIGRKANPVMKRDEYPKYLFYDLNIQNAQKYHQFMIQEGYLEPAPIEAMLDTLKLPELKEITNKYNLPAAGKKANLIATIVDGVPQEDFDTIFPEKKYVLSEAGQAFLDENEDYVTLWQHRGWQIDADEYDAARKPGEDVYDTCLRIMQKRAEKASSAYDKRQAFYKVSLLLKMVDKNQEALLNLLRVLYIDVNAQNCGSLQSYRDGYITKNEFLKHASEEIFFAPGIIKDIGDLDEYYSVDMIDQVYSDKSGLQLCPKDLFRDIVGSIMDGNFDEEYYKKRLAAAYRKA